jgi:flagella basal body P-ring formation protein FlgA
MTSVSVTLTAHALFGCVLLLGTAATAGAEPWQALAETTLQRALMVRYPGVEQWRIDALLGTRPAQRLATQDAVDAEVLQLGKRSAVRLWCAQPRRQCATVWFAVSGTQQLLSSTTEVPPASALTPAALVLREHDVLALRCEPLAASADWIGARTTQRLRAGQALCRHSLEPRPAVSRGEAVMVRVSIGAVAIHARAIAQQDGNPGQLVRLRRAQDVEPFVATVTGMGQVTLNGQ